MDFVNGTDAAHLLADSGALPAKHVVAIVDAIADALDFAHQR
jgi:serine/threonine-protein kinase